MKSLQLERISTSGVRGELDERPREVEVRKKVVARTAQSVPVLADAAVCWLAELPADVRPIALARKFPRIANSIADLWRRVARCEEYLDSLLVDLRGDRTGFPPDVDKELRTLRSYYADLHPQQGPGLHLVELED